MKDKTDKYMDMVKQMQAEGAAAHSKSDYAARAKSYKTSLSGAPGEGRRSKRSRTPEKKVVVVQQDGGRRREEKEEKPVESRKKTAEVFY